MSEEQARVFFALWPDEETRRKLQQWRDRLHAQTQGRPMQAEGLHLTLAFLGDTPLATVERAMTAADEVPPRRFDLRIDMPAYWQHNRIAWAGARSVPQVLKELVADLRGALIRARVPFDAKPFVPHITLIRNARMGVEDLRLPAVDWSVDRFVLARSSHRASSRYEIMREWIAA